MIIKLLLTGGTIDKHYNQSNGELGFDKTHILEILELGHNHAEVIIEEVMFKDSLDMDDTDRQTIFSACEKTTQNKILITHGTDSMVDTATVLGKGKLGKTIVLLGAMVPYEFKHSDAMFNLGFSLAAVQTLKHGVYIVMNGKVFDWDKVRKNREQGVFEIL